MNKRILGSRCGVEVGEIGFGAWAIGGTHGSHGYGPTNDRVSAAAVLEALDLGCTFFDTADVYGHGHSEALLGVLLSRTPREEVQICTKAGLAYMRGPHDKCFDADYLEQQLRGSLRRLRTDYVDFFLLHNPTQALIEKGEIFAGLERLRSLGLTRHIGISIHQPIEGLLAMERCELDVIEVVYNFVHQDAGPELLPKARAEGVGIIAREPLSNGFLSGRYRPGARFPEGDIRVHWHPDFIARLHSVADVLERYAVKPPLKSPAQAALRFVLDHPDVGVCIPGMKTPAQVQENLAVTKAPPLQLPDIEHLLGPADRR